VGVDGSAVLELRLRVPLVTGPLTVELTTHERSVAIFGPSGGGKSTILRTLAGVERDVRGVVRVVGEEWQNSESGLFIPPWQRRVGWVPQDFLLFPHLTVQRNLGYSGATPEEVRDMAGRLMLEHLLDGRPRRLSGGERQRVALGRALLARPRLLLLDEPFSALDRPLRVRVGEVVRSFALDRKIPLVLVSHDEVDAAALAEEQWKLSQGRLEKVT
jgi:molybdate transport system ATP-binding protein